MTPDDLKSKYKEQTEDHLSFVFDRNLNRPAEEWKDYELEYKKLMEFILLGEVNPYTYLGARVINPSSLEGAVSLLTIINHAMIDDGDLCFIESPNFKFHPMLVFYHHSETTLINEYIGESKHKKGHTFEFVAHVDVDRFIFSIKNHEQYYNDLHIKNEKWLKSLEKDLDTNPES